jgi:hypothetical protein
MFKIGLIIFLLICGFPLIFGFVVLYPAWALSREEREW